MSSLEEKLLKLRQERVEREKARIQKLKELNLQKYSNATNNSVAKAPTKSQSTSIRPASVSTTNNVTSRVKNNLHTNAITKRPISVSEPVKKSITNHIAPRKSEIPLNLKPTCVRSASTSKNEINNKNLNKIQQPKVQKIEPKGYNGDIKKTIRADQNVNAKSQIGKKFDKRITLAPSTSVVSKSCSNVSQPQTNRSSVLPQTMTQSASKPKRISVFERLYKPKPVAKASISSDAQKLRDPIYLKKIIENSSLITGKRHTIAHTNTVPVRRSISAVHLKRAPKSELKSCMHTWASIGEKLDKVNINEVDEDDYIKCDKVVSAIKSEVKKVKFRTPVTSKYNTPKSEELQLRLQNWLQKRGKSIDSYHHLQCFGVFHLAKGQPVIETPELFDEENKENIALESDSDDRSYTENLNDRKNDFVTEKKIESGNNKWRRVSSVSDTLSLNESRNTTLTSADDVYRVDELVTGALNDLTELLREGFDWEQCARWLRAIRERFPSAPEGSAYWECRAALEEHRGDLPASMQCWEEAIAMGSERSVADANLDQLLDKFMQLKISPNSGRQKQVDPKLVDVKNVLKSTIIRFAVQKLRQKSETPKYTVTPVRRSARLSIHGSAKRTPLQLCATIIQASTLGHPVIFKRNEQLFGTP